MSDQGREIYHSENGARWLLCRDNDGGVFVLHNANLSSGKRESTTVLRSSEIPRRMPGSAPSASISSAAGALQSQRGQDGRNITSWTAQNSFRIRERSAPS
jgi:hypothetical protein